MSLQPNEVLIIVLVALIVLGPKRLPGAIRGIGRAFRQMREFSTTVRQEMDATLSPPKVEPASPPASPATADPVASKSPSDAADPEAIEHSAQKQAAADDADADLTDTGAEAEASDGRGSRGHEQPDTAEPSERSTTSDGAA